MEVSANSGKKLRWLRAEHGWVAGVCQGLADALQVEVWIIRLLWIVSLCWFGTGLVIYLLAAISLPRADLAEKALQRRVLGVCARLATRYDFEVGLVRLFMCLAALSSLGLTIFAYVVAALVMPKQENA